MDVLRSRNETRTDDLAVRVDRRCTAVPTTERAEVRHLPVLPEERMLLSTRCAVRAYDLAALVDRCRATARPRRAERPEIGDRPTLATGRLLH